jgi:hypothetical protein
MGLDSGVDSSGVFAIRIDSPILYFWEFFFLDTPGNSAITKSQVTTPYRIFLTSHPSFSYSPPMFTFQNNCSLSMCIATLCTSQINFIIQT